VIPFWRRPDALNLPQTWKAIAALPLDGEQQIVPVKVGKLKPLKGVTVHPFLTLLEKRA
jgi:hypothetical protein